MTGNLFLSFDGTKIEADVLAANKPRAGVLFWPCMGGSFQMYRFPREEFLRRGISVVLFNPRGHGASGGQMEISLALRDVDHLLAKNGLTGLPFVGIGHSAGANALLQYAADKESFLRFFLVAPVLDSRRSLEYLYAEGNIREFNDILALRAGKTDVISEHLNDSRWMDGDYWREMNLRRYMDGKSGELQIGSFLENLFIPGHNAFNLLQKEASRTDILLAVEDHWYPLEETRAKAREYGISLREISQARDHFFTRAWPPVWEYIIGEIDKLRLPG